MPPLGAVRSFTVRMWLSVSKFEDGAVTELFSSYGAPTAIEGTTNAAGASDRAVDLSVRLSVWSGLSLLCLSVRLSVWSGLSLRCLSVRLSV